MDLNPEGRRSEVKLLPRELWWARFQDQVSAFDSPWSTVESYLTVHFMSKGEKKDIPVHSFDQNGVGKLPSFFNNFLNNRLQEISRRADFPNERKFKGISWVFDRGEWEMVIGTATSLGSRNKFLHRMWSFYVIGHGGVRYEIGQLDKTKYGEDALGNDVERVKDCNEWVDASRAGPGESPTSP